MSHATTRTLRVVGALIVDGDRFLLTQRRLDDASWPGFWEFPGGKVAPGESDPQALEREMEEELGIEVEVVRQVDRVKLDLGDGNLLDFRVHLCRLLGGEPQPLEVADLRWVTAQEAAELDLPEADRPVLGRILAGGLP